MRGVVCSRAGARWLQAEGCNVRGICAPCCIGVLHGQGQGLQQESIVFIVAHKFSSVGRTVIETSAQPRWARPEQESQESLSLCTLRPWDIHMTDPLAYVPR